MQRVIKYTFLLVVSVIIASCSDTGNNVTAEKMTIQQLAVTPGYTWFNFEFNQYTPDSFAITEIKKEYNADAHSFVIFAKPSCSCPGKHKQTPEFVKTLDLSQIPMDKCQIYSMASVSNNHPFKGAIEIKELPTIVVLKNGVPVFSVTDTLNSLNDNNPNNPMTIEQTLIMGLMK
ncbi:hypothetical protein MASR1M45_05480 [Candidatus Kapaibacterium sp.]